MGESTTVQCSINSGDLPIYFYWFLNGESLGNIRSVSLSSVGKKTSVLSIDAVSEIHAGNYTCLVENKAGKNSYSAELFVEGISFFSHYVVILISNAISYFLQDDLD